MGGAISAGDTKDVWYSTDKGTSWTQYTGTPNWPARHEHNCVVLPDGKIVLMGGTGLGFGKMNDVWISSDKGESWDQQTPAAAWSKRQGSSSVALPDGSIILMGGLTNSAYLNDIWRSTNDGATWTQITTTGSMWEIRTQHTSVVLADGSIVMMGGNSGGMRADVWRSTDKGESWTQMNKGAWDTGRGYPSSVVMPDGSIILTGGRTSDGRYKNDVWRSTDNGASWTQVNTNAWDSGRNGHSSVALPDGSIVIMGGYDSSGYKNDVWRLAPAGSTLKNPSHTYTVPGTYQVSLQVYYDAEGVPGYYSKRKPGYITVNPGPPTVTSISPSSGVNTGSVSITDLAGTGFLAGATVNLTKAGENNITATKVVITSTKITCYFDLTGKTAGSWNVNVTNTDGQEAMLASGFTINPPTTPTPTPTTTPTPIVQSASDDDGPPVPAQPVQNAPRNERTSTSSVNVGQIGHTSITSATVTGAGVRDVVVTAIEAKGPGKEAAPAPGVVYEYADITPAQYTTISEAKIDFVVSESWLKENHLAPQDVVMYHNTGKTWTALPTTLVMVKNGNAYYTAKSPGFSRFAISCRANSTLSAQNATPTAVPTFGGMPQEPVTTRPTRAVAEKALEDTPVATQTTVAPPAPQPSPGFTFGTLVLTGAAGIVLIGGVFIVRRWWIRRQNPALFREYE
ncbi:MAG: PGF-pre-PGF domain-containing protein [Methanoregula sp.]|nr:PGF-pre-PGF domain-containing protein [Methanoregula sp.]